MRLPGLLAGLVIFPHLLLPFERGFPRLNLGVATVSVSIVVNACALLIATMHSRGSLLNRFRDPYVAFQGLYLCVFLLSAAMTDALPAAAALHGLLQYGGVFVASYIVFKYAVEQGAWPMVVWFAVAAGVAAACLGLAEVLFGYRPAVYQQWYASYIGAELPALVEGPSRGIGPLANPILFGTSMVLCIPFAFEMRRSWYRRAAVALLVAAAIGTASRTALLVLAVFAVGAAVIHGSRAVARIAVGLVFTILAIPFMPWGAILSTERGEFLAGRLGIGEGMVAQFALENISIRQNAIRVAVDELLRDTNVFNWLLGHGHFTASQLGARVLQGYSTIDNTYLTILYERGIVGLFLFLGAFLWALYRTRQLARRSLHWYAPVALLCVGVSFNFESYSGFNTLAMASLAAIVVASRAHRASLGPSRVGKPHAQIGEAPQSQVLVGKPRVDLA